LNALPKAIRAGARRRPPYLLLAPFFLLYLVFWLVPLGYGALLSLYGDAISGRGDYLGLAHYLSLLGDGRFHRALLNTGLYAGGVLVTVVPLALALALALAAVPYRLREVFQFMLLLPGLVAPAVLAILFLLVFSGPYGLLNTVLLAPFGSPDLDWLRDPLLIRVGLVIQALWRWTGLIAFFLAAGLGSLPRRYYDVAELEGSSGLQTLRYVTLPLLRPILAFVGLVLVFDAFVLFSGAYVLLGGSGGPQDAGLLLVTYIYLTAFSFGDFSYAAAMSYALIPLLALFVFLFMRYKSSPLMRGS
jgi:ABC-type sugar transport system permease subunit